MGTYTLVIEMMKYMMKKTACNCTTYFSDSTQQPEQHRKFIWTYYDGVQCSMYKKKGTMRHRYNVYSNGTASQDNCTQFNRHPRPLSPSSTASPRSSRVRTPAYSTFPSPHYSENHPHSQMRPPYPSQTAPVQISVQHQKRP